MIKLILLSPLAMALVCLLFARLLVAFGNRRTGSCLAYGALMFLFLLSVPRVSDGLRSPLESSVPDLPETQLPPADVIVVLGGLSSPGTATHPDADFAASVDRVFRAARLYHSGRAPLVLASGGREGRAEPEARAMQRLLRELAVPDAAVILEESSVSTAANAAETATMLRARSLTKVLLVTSALHMPRAIRHFEAQGLEVFPAPADFEVRGDQGWAGLVPSAQALDGSARAIKEYLGLALLRVQR